MDIYGKIAQKIKTITGTTGGGQSMIFTAQIKSVSQSVCTINIDGLEVSDVRLRAVVNNENEQFFIKPKKDSYVLVADLSGGTFRQLAVIGYSEIETVNIKIGDTTLDMDKNGVVFNGGNLNGMVKAEAMVNWMAKVYADMQTLITGLAAVPYSFVPTTPMPQLSNFENTKVKQ